MPTNLPPEARAKWIKVMEARTLEEKIAALEEFISAVPKHKGTENLMLWATRRLSQLKEELEEKKRRKVGFGPRFFVEKEGSAQLVMLGWPSSGKTLLLAKLTNAKVEASPIPFSTTLPQPGMMKFEDVLLQLVDAPSLPFGLGEKVSWYGRTIGLARNADGVILVVDLSRDVDKQLKSAVQELEENGILLGKQKAVVSFTKTSAGGINIVVIGRLIDATPDDVRKLLLDYRIHHGIVRIIGEASIDDVEAAILGNRDYKPSVIVGNKLDIAGQDSVEVLGQLARKLGVPYLAVSALRGDNLSLLPKMCFESLELIRIYTKQPSGEVARKPLVLRKGATVLDVARAIHSSFAENFKYARIWGPSAKYPGERVGKDHVLKDGDVVEIRA